MENKNKAHRAPHSVVFSDDITAVKFSIELTAQHEQYFSNLFAYMREISSWIFRKFKSGEIVKVKPFALEFSDGSQVSDRAFKKLPEIKALIEQYFGGDVLATNVDAINWQTARCYASYGGRNKKLPKSAIVVRPKSFSPKADMFQFDAENEEVLMRKVEKDVKEPHLRFKVKGCYYDNADLLEYTKRNPSLSKKQGGILSLKKGELVLLARRVVEYTPVEKWIGLDINKSSPNWIAWSEEVPITGEKLFPKTLPVREIEERIRLKQRKITGKDKDDQLNSRQRSGVRGKWKKLHRKHEALVATLVGEILSSFKAVYGEFGLGIDTVATGDKNGTFGQDKIIKAAAKWMKDNKLPYMYVPTPNTSRRCSCCGNVSKTARTSTNVYICNGCGHVEHADENAAVNIAAFAKAMQDEGVRMTSTLNRQYKIECLVFLNLHFDLKKA